jgi:uncharacterized membrane protein YdjX (TVP38/TMEM64 family)
MQAAAGLTPMLVASFTIAAWVGGSIRASIFAYFGNALIDSNSMSLVYATAAFVVVMALPFAFPSGRAWLREIFDPVSAHEGSGDS